MILTISQGKDVNHLLFYIKLNIIYILMKTPHML